MSESTLAKLGRALGPKYEVRRVVGSGGFAEVYEVWDKDLERRLAVKVLRPDVAWTSGMIERFQRETRAAARLEHANILPIHFVGEEEALGDPNLGPASDLYSLGAVLCQMVTGAPPFDGESSQQIVGKHIADPPPAAADVNPNVPRELSDVILRLLAKQPGERFHSAGEVIAALESDKQPSTMRSRASAAQAATELLVSGARTQPTPRARPRRVGWVVLVIALPVLLLAAGAMFFRQPTLVFQNRLTDMVAVQVSGEERRILPGGSFALKLDRAGRLDLSWQLVSRLGVSLGDTITIANPRGTVHLAATPRPAHGAFLVPLITNQTGEPLSITVNAGLAGSQPCGCTIPPGTARMAIGYYPLFENSTVRAEAGSRSATFKDLGPQVDMSQGTVGLLL